MADAPIEVPNDVQVNYSADGITMNLFSIFENKSMNTDFLFEIMKNKIGVNKVDYLYIFIKFNPDDTLTFLYAPTPSSAQIVSIESFFSVNNITEEFIKNAKLENPHLNKEEIFNVYTLLVFLWITHIIQSLKKTNITSFLKDHIKTSKYLGLIFLILFLEIIGIKLPGVYFPIFDGLASHI